MAELETISFETSKPVIVKLFKFLNEQKKINKTRASLMNKIKELAPYLNIPEGFERFLLELYILNFREDGDYSQLSKDNYVDPRKRPGKTTPNTQSSDYTRAQLPFKASNLRGYWSRDRNGVEQYIVESYGWYPIYVYKEGKWYQIVDSYSSSTGKQISNANPVDWDDDLNANVTLFAKEDMKDLINGLSPDVIKKKRLERLKKRESELVKARKTFVNTYGGWEEPIADNLKIKYKISGVDIQGDKAVVTVDIHDVSKRKGSQTIDTPENYLKGELRGVTKDSVERNVESKLKGKFREFIGKRFNYRDRLSDIYDLKFKFNHLKENQ